MFSITDSAEKIITDGGTSLFKTSTSDEVLRWVVLNLCADLDAHSDDIWKVIVENTSYDETPIKDSKIGTYVQSVIKSSMNNIFRTLIQVDIISTYEMDPADNRSMSVRLYNCRGEDVNINVSWEFKGFNISLNFDSEGFSVEKMISEIIADIYLPERTVSANDLYNFYVITNYFDIDLRNLDLGRQLEWGKTPYNEVVCKKYAEAYSSLQKKKPEFFEIMDRLHAFMYHSESHNVWSGVDKVVKNLRNENIERFLQANAPARFLLVGHRALSEHGFAIKSNLLTIYTPFEELTFVNLGDVHLSHYHFTDDAYLTLFDEEHNIYLPSKERVLIDGMAWCEESYDEGELVEAIQDYIFECQRDFSKLYEVADHYGVKRELVDYWVKKADEETV